ncbi:MAG TPA: hypothetical protein VLB44_14770 [Kofleriaceae bacterium]|nr:hypothetical protein [Kofleriaceae bacterium]
MKRLLASMVVLAMAAPAAHAEPQEGTERGEETWRNVFAGSLMVTLTGATLVWWGDQRMDTAEHALCTGSYEGSACGHSPPQTVAEVDSYNAKGEHAQNVARAGGAIFLVGAAFTIYAGYRGFVKEHPKYGSVTIAPTASPNSAGAQLMLRW